MNVLQSSFYAIGIGLCLLTLLLLKKHNGDTPLRFFKLIVLVQTLRFTFEWLMIHPNVPLAMLWLFGVMSLSLLIAPLAWAFAHDLSTLKKNFTFQHAAPHLAVIVLGNVLLIPLIATLFPDSVFRQMRWPGAPEYAVVHVTMLLMAGVFFAQSAFYLRRCFRLFQLRVSQNKGLLSVVDDTGSDTLRILLVAVIANSAISLLRVVYCWALDETPVLNVILAYLQIVCMAYLAYAVMQQVFSQRAVLDQTRQDLFEAQNSVSKYQHSGLTEPKRADILNRLESLLDKDKLHRQSDVNLGLLCELLEASAQDVSQTINQSHYQSFYQMIHRHRIADAQQLLLQNPDRSVLEIAYEVGYNSKSTFNSAFKRLSDCSPSAYRDTHVAEGTATQFPA